jgi:GntR family transcriptional regulator
MTPFYKIEGVARYIQIREALREEISSKRLQAGEKLPSEDELATQFGVSRMTVRQGVADLLEEGLLYRKHGVGTFVSQPQVSRDHSRLTNFFESSLANHVQASLRVLISEIKPVKLKIAKALDLDEGDLVIRIKSLQLVDDIPIAVHDAYVPYKLFPHLLKEDLETRSIWDYMGQSGYPIKRAVQKLEAHEADEKLARLLGVDAGAPTLYKERTVYTEDGTPVEFTYCYNRGDRYSLTVTLSR